MAVDEFACVPPCVQCQDNGCAIVNNAPRNDKVEFKRDWMPNRLAEIRLPCGCMGIPWPIFHTFGESVVRIDCNEHGFQTVSKTYRKDKIKEARKLRREYEKRVAKASMMTLDELMKEDPPPF